MSRLKRLLSSGLLVLALSAMPMEGHAAPTWQKVTVGAGAMIYCTKQVSTGYLAVVAPVTVSFFYTMYGGGGGGGGNSTGLGGRYGAISGNGGNGGSVTLTYTAPNCFL